MSTAEAPWQRLVERYLESLALERGLSRNTVDAYGGTSRALVPICRGRRRARRRRQESGRRHLRKLRRGDAAPRSIARALVAIRSFYAPSRGERRTRPTTQR
jgi:site-specific recombinase XerD